MSGSQLDRWRGWAVSSFISTGIINLLRFAKATMQTHILSLSPKSTLTFIYKVRILKKKKKKSNVLTWCATKEQIAKMTHKSRIPKLSSGTECQSAGTSMSCCLWGAERGAAVTTRAMLFAGLGDSGFKSWVPLYHRKHIFRFANTP